MNPSSGNTGFFQQPPVLRNQYYDDANLQRVVELFLPRSLIEQVEPEIARLGDEVLSPKIFDWVADAERNLPYLRGDGRDIFGRPRSELVLTEGWRKLQEFGIKNGVVACNYDTDLGEYTRIVQFLKLHLWEASCANTSCPAAMQDGAARLLQRHLAGPGLDTAQRAVFQNAFWTASRRANPERAWTSGQWMTERSGGSDVSQTETVAVYVPFPNGGEEEGDGEAAVGGTPPLADAGDGTPLGPWSISGFKWFSSATDSQMTILLAKTAPGSGLSAFFAPMRRHDPSTIVSPTGTKGGPEPNGVAIQRLKNKFGTRSLPTAELELRGMRGWLVGDEGKGIQEISTILAITRLHSALTALGYLGRCLGVARAYARVREVGAGRGRRVVLARHPLHVRTLANLTGEYHALMLLVFYTVSVLGRDERTNRDGSESTSSSAGTGPLLAALSPPTRHVVPMLRVLGSLQKAYACETAVPLLFGAMAALGGLGYLAGDETESLNVARLFRDACVLPIWEGTTDVLAADTLRALKHATTGGEAIDALDWVLDAALRTGSADKHGVAADAVAQEWAAVRERLVNQSQEALLPGARDLIFRIAEILIAALLLADVRAGGGQRAEVVCRRWMAKRRFIIGKEDDVSATSLEQDVRTDPEIVYGAGGVGLRADLGEKEASKL